MRFLLPILFVVLACGLLHCSPPAAKPCIAISGSVNTQQQGDFLLVAHVTNTEGSCTDGKATSPCAFDVDFEVRVRVPGSEQVYEPVENHSEVLKMLKTSGKRLVWSGGEMRGNTGKKGDPLIVNREKSFRQAANTGKAYTLYVTSVKKVELYPLNPDKSEMGKLELATRVALQCESCDGELPPIVEAGQFSSWW